MLTDILRHGNDSPLRLLGVVLLQALCIVQVCTSNCATRELLAFWAEVASTHRADYIIHAEDVVYLNPERLLAAAAQWSVMRAGYIGCMAHKKVIMDEKHAEYDEASVLLVREHPLSADAGFFAVNGTTIYQRLLPISRHLRHLRSVGAPSSPSRRRCGATARRCNFLVCGFVCSVWCHACESVDVSSWCS